MNRRLVVAAYRLPFNIAEGEGSIQLKQNSGGLVSAILSLVQNMHDHPMKDIEDKITWFGFLEEESRLSDSDHFESEYFIGKPVYINNDLNENFYAGFCNATLWPLFHYYPYLTRYSADYFEAYKEANLKYYEVMKKELREDDVIWIHDYHLFLLPELIRKDFPNAQIGFFLHIPFPSYEIFRLIPKSWSLQLLKGLLGADLIGFHTTDYVQHFLKSVMRITGYESGGRTIKTGDRLIRVDAFPISIDYEKFNDAFAGELTKSYRQKMKNHLGSEKIIFSVDRLDYSKGLMHRLLGFETFLTENPEWHTKVKLVMVVVPSRDSIQSYAEMKRELEEAIGRINGKFGRLEWLPISYQYRSLVFEELIALYSVSDAALITPIRDGMNLVAKEFIASRKDEKGVLILSEMAGSAMELGEAIQINPTDKNEISLAIKQALIMPEKEQRLRILSMQQRIKNYDVFHWANDFITQLDKVKIIQRKMNMLVINDALKEEILEKYEASKQRVLFLDYDGTLVPFDRNPAKAAPDRQVILLLKRLTYNNKVIIISGRDKVSLNKWLGHLDLTLIAEHGAFVRREGEEEWERNKKISVSWKNDVREILQRYVDRCAGSFIEEKEASLAWHYRNSELDFAFGRSRELLDELSEFAGLINDITIIDGKKVLEVKNKSFSKGTAVTACLEEIKPDFILCAGDDSTDEDMFGAVPHGSISIKIGKEPSRAQYSMRNMYEFRSLLSDMAKENEEALIEKINEIVLEPVKDFLRKIF